MRVHRAVMLAASLCIVGAIGLAYGQSRAPLGLQIKAIPSAIKGDQITSATLSGSGLLALGTASGKLSILDRKLRPWGGEWKRSADSSAIFRVSFSQDEAAIAGATLGAVFIWRLNDPTVVKMEIPLKEAPPAMALSPGGRWLALANFDVFVFDVAGRRFVRKFEQDMKGGGISEYGHMAFSLDASVVVAASGDSIDAWNIESGKRVLNWSCNCGADGVTFSRDAALAVFGTGDARAVLVDLASETVLKYKSMSILEGDHVYGTAVSLKGTLVAAGTAGGAVVVWDTVSGVIIARAQPSGQPITRITSSDDGQLLLVEGQKAEYVRGSYDRWLMTLTQR
ncbi:WD40 repeat protein [Bradyrhizobium japonicum]